MDKEQRSAERPWLAPRAEFQFSETVEQKERDEPERFGKGQILEALVNV